MLKGYDEWLWRQADEYYSNDYMEDCEDGECGECNKCLQEQLEAHEEAKADAAYEEMKYNNMFAHEEINRGGL